MLEAADIIILIEEKERSSLDRKMLEAKFGVDQLKTFERVTAYLQVNVKKVN